MLQLRLNDNLETKLVCVSVLRLRVSRKGKSIVETSRKLERQRSAPIFAHRGMRDVTHTRHTRQARHEARGTERSAHKRGVSGDADARRL